MDDLTLLARYVAAQARYNLLLPWLDPQAAKRFVSHVIEHDFLRGAGRRLETSSIHDIFPEISETTWTTVGAAFGIESTYLCGVLRAIDARTVLEIGTFLGATTLQLAANLPPSGRVFTVDIDSDDVSGAACDISDFDLGLAQKKRERIGLHFRDTPHAERITQILGDSARIDYAGHFDKVDLAYIDGGHSYEQVKTDTEKVLGLVRPGGVIFWHDYQPGCLGVTRYLHELARERPLKHIRKTDLAVLRL